MQRMQLLYESTFGQWSRFENDVHDVVPLVVLQVTTLDPGTRELPGHTIEKLRESQDQDPDLKVVIAWLQSDYVSDQNELSLSSLLVKQLWLCRSQLGMDGPCSTSGKRSQIQKSYWSLPHH